MKTRTPRGNRRPLFFPSANCQFNGTARGEDVEQLNFSGFGISQSGKTITLSAPNPGAGTVNGAALKAWSINGHTASGGAETFAHSLGTAPTYLTVTPQNTAGTATPGVYSITKSSDGTNVTITATAGLVYDAFAM